MEQDKFYVLSANQSRKYKYLKKLIRGKLEIRKECDLCGHYVEYDDEAYKNLEFEISDNVEFPDNIMFGGSPNFLFISRKSFDEFSQEGITGFEAYPIVIFQRGEKVEQQYFILKICGKAAYNYKKMGKKPLTYCEKCGYTGYSGKPPFNYEFTYLKENSWDGSDIFLNKYCTEKVIDVIKKYKLTGFDARDMIHAFNPFYSEFTHL